MFENIIKSIITQDNKIIKGPFSWEACSINGRKTISAVSKEYTAKTCDKIICSCEKCDKEITIRKRELLYKVKRYDNRILCSDCGREFTCFKKYGYYSHNQVPEIKEKQHPHLKGVDWKLFQPLKGKRFVTKEALSRFRSEQAQKYWEEDKFYPMIKGVRHPSKKTYYKRKTKNNRELSQLRSQITKENWKQGVYNDFKESIKKKGFYISQFQKEVFYYVNNSIHIVEIEKKIAEANIFVDILSKDKKLIIECYGDYWHCSPLKYKEDYLHPHIKKTARVIRKTDQKRIRRLRDYGYTIIIVWESEWKKTKNKIKKKLKEAFESN